MVVLCQAPLYYYDSVRMENVSLIYLSMLWTIVLFMFHPLDVMLGYTERRCIHGGTISTVCAEGDCRCKI